MQYELQAKFSMSSSVPCIFSSHVYLECVLFGSSPCCSTYPCETEVLILVILVLPTPWNLGLSHLLKTKNIYKTQNVWAEELFFWVEVIELVLHLVIWTIRFLQFQVRTSIFNPTEVWVRKLAVIAPWFIGYYGVGRPCLDREQLAYDWASGLYCPACILWHYSSGGWFESYDISLPCDSTNQIHHQ